MYIFGMVGVPIEGAPELHPKVDSAFHPPWDGKMSIIFQAE